MTPRKAIISLESVSSGISEIATLHARLNNFPTPHLTTSLQSDLKDRFVVHLHTHFLAANSFTGRSNDNTPDIQSLIRSSPALLNAVMAVGSLCLRREHKDVYNSKITALRLYRVGVSSLQADLQDEMLTDNYSVLWSTFFLGIFEVRLPRNTAETSEY